MSRSKKKLKNRMARRVIDGKISAGEARRALAAAGVQGRGPKAAGVAVKSAGAGQPALSNPVAVYKSYTAPGSRPAALTPRQRSLLETYRTHSDPRTRENALKAALDEGGAR